jgi:predicted methyltransferase
LPAESIDLAFICDTYHHFEYPRAMLASIHQALKPGAELVVVDFELILGKSSNWVISHVRAGKEEVIAEIQAAGFELIEDNQQVLRNNYFLRFRKLPDIGS